MKKSLIAALISGLAYSQVGINTTAPARLWMLKLS